MGSFSCHYDWTGDPISMQSDDINHSHSSRLLQPPPDAHFLFQIYFCYCYYLLCFVFFCSSFFFMLQNSMWLRRRCQRGWENNKRKQDESNGRVKTETKTQTNPKGNPTLKKEKNLKK